MAQQPHDREAREAAKQTLLYPPVQFNGTQARAIGRGFAESIQKGGVTIWSCAILPEHVHLVIARHTSKVEQVVNFLKGAATKQLLKEGIHPFQELRTPKGKVPKCFARGAWRVYLDNAKAIDRANRYVEGNPEKEGKPRQRWHCVTPFDPAALEMV